MIADSVDSVVCSLIATSFRATPRNDKQGESRQMYEFVNQVRDDSGRTKLLL